MRLAQLQMDARPGAVEANLARIEQGAAEAAAKGAELLLTPELAIQGYGAGEAMATLAEPLDGPQVRRLQEIAARNRIALVIGFAEKAGDRLYNAALLVRPDSRISCYRKYHLYSDYEKSLFAPGEALPAVFEVAGLKVGLLICYDVEFPEAVRHLALAGAQLIAVPTALPASNRDDFIAERIIPVRAFESQVFVAYTNFCGRDSLFVYAGRSCVAGPDGRDLARAAPKGEALLVSALDPDGYEEARRVNPYFADRRLGFG